jgi:glycosyltransferase involved in cell wall biosynthesis
MAENNKLRVVMVTPAFPLQDAPVNGGVEGVSLYLSLALAEIPEIDLQVIMPMAPPGAGGLKQIYGLKVHFLEQNNTGARFIFAANPKPTQQLIQELSPHIIHFQDLPTWAMRCALPNIVTLHGITERDALYRGSPITSRFRYWVIRLIENRARRRSKNLIVINPYVYKFLGSRKSQQVWNIPNPVAEGFFSTQYHPEVGRIFSACHMIPLKNIHTLIKAFSQLATCDPRLELRLAGSGQDSSYGQQCRGLAGALGLNQRIKFLGLQSQECIREELSRADCFALCSYQENAPLSISEAMAVGVPVVASRVGGIPWMVADGITGALVDAMDAADIARGLKQVLFSKDQARMAAAARHSARALYDPSEVANKTLDAYSFILGAQ